MGGSSREVRAGRMLRAVALAAAVFAALIPGGSAGAAAGDPQLAQQWGLAAVGAPSVWSRTRGAGITVAVLDSGVDANQEDLRGAVRGSVSCVGAAGNASRCSPVAGDDDGHGTHVAGIVAARAGNGVGGAGVAPAASVLSVKVLSHECQPQTASAELCKALGSSDDVSAGIRWAVDHDADVINISIASDATSTLTPVLPIGDAVQYAWSKGAVVVAATGNNFGAVAGPGYDHLPMVVVAATAPGDAHPGYSNPVGDAMWAVSAPGGEGATGSCPAGNVLSTYPGGSGAEYRCMWGTSMAAPHVAGALALLRAEGYSAPAAVARLLATVHDLGAPGPDPTFGAGRIDAAAATAAAPAAASPPRAEIPQAAARTATAPASSSSAARSAARPSVTTPPTTTPAAQSAVAAPATGTSTSGETSAWSGLAGRARASLHRPMTLLLIAAMLLLLTIAAATRLLTRNARPE